MVSNVNEQRISVIGLGYVGTVTRVCLAELGKPVLDYLKKFHNNKKRKLK